MDSCRSTRFQLPSPEQYSALGKYGSALMLLGTADSRTEGMLVPVQTRLRGTGLDPWETSLVWNCGWI